MRGDARQGMAVERGTLRSLAHAEHLARMKMDEAKFNFHVAEGRLFDDAPADRPALCPPAGLGTFSNADGSGWPSAGTYEHRA
jgi:hypothetical protein